MSGSAKTALKVPSTSLSFSISWAAAKEHGPRDIGACSNLLTARVPQAEDCVLRRRALLAFSIFVPAKTPPELHVPRAALQTVRTMLDGVQVDSPEGGWIGCASYYGVLHRSLLRTTST